VIDAEIAYREESQTLKFESETAIKVHEYRRGGKRAPEVHTGPSMKDSADDH